MRWDWYQATVPAASDRVIAALVAGYPGAEVHQGRGLHGFAYRSDLQAGGDTVATVLHGGSNPMPNAWASGELAPRFAGVLRDVFPQHRVTRFDACQDFEEPGVFDRLSKMVLSFADAHKLKVSHAGDWHRGQDGRTLYLGSRSSPVLARLYEKGIQQREAAQTLGEPVRADWVRLELRVRPEGPAREVCATMQPEQAWGLSRWSPQLLRAVMATEVRRVSMHNSRVPDAHLSFHHMVGQYANVLNFMRAEAGGWREIGELIGQLLERSERLH